MMKRILTYLTTASMLMLMSCSSDSQLEEVHDITESTDPMRFSSINNQNQVTRTDPNIPNLLKQNFLVSTYKNYGNANQQEVMPMYEVNYEPYTASNLEKTSWNYISADSGHPFYQTQYEKYWDYSAFPYRFHAVSPAPIKDGQLTSGFVLNDKTLYIPSPYIYQTCTDGVISEGAEPCLVAQVERFGNGHDYDLLAKEIDDTYPKEINGSGGLSKIRSVALPFHHLTSKVRFAIYCPEVGEGDNHEISDVKIKVRSSNFITSASDYSANLSGDFGAMSGSFTTLSTSNHDVTLLEISQGAKQTGNDLYYANDPSTAYWFECKDGIMQIPQKDVQLSVSFLIRGRFEDPSLDLYYIGEYTQFNDVPIALTSTHQDTYTWEKNTLYTYYIILSRFRTTDPIYPIIVCTCTEEPWEDVSGSLSTNLEQ